MILECHPAGRGRARTQIWALYSTSSTLSTVVPWRVSSISWQPIWQRGLCVPSEEPLIGSARPWRQGCGQSTWTREEHHVPAYTTKDHQVDQNLNLSKTTKARALPPSPSLPQSPPGICSKTKAFSRNHTKCFWGENLNSKEGSI